MKRICYFIVSLICASILQACKNRDGFETFDPRPGLSMTIVKFLSPDYKDYVVVEKDYDGDYEHICKIRAGGNACQEFFLGQSPYIPLPQGYYLVDWKWGQFIYEPTNFLIDVKWDEVENRQQKWQYPSITVATRFLKLWGGTSYKNIDKYLNITPTVEKYHVYFKYIEGYYERPTWMSHYNSLSDIYNSDFPIEDYQPCVMYLDSLQNVYKERISQIILDGNLEKVGYYYKH